MSLLEGLLPTLHPELGRDQHRAMSLLGSESNVFITGGAGTGKSYLMTKFLGRIDRDLMPVLASTGAAAVLVGGRTFHSFFGLGIMEGGVAATVQRASENRRVIRRLRKARGLVIDEVSMIPGSAFDAAERVARIARNRDEPWGGLRIVAVGDFAQLPPIPQGGVRDWAFRAPVWERSEFKSVVLAEMMRTQNSSFASVLNTIREGEVDQAVSDLLEWRCMIDEDPDFEGSVLFGRREEVSRLNMARLAELPGSLHTYPTRFAGDERVLKSLRQNMPIPEVLELKTDALVMLRQNDPLGRWVNGSLGRVLDCSDEELYIRLLSGKTITLQPASFRLLDGEGQEVASARNFPVTLAYAVTIHKAQGATLDRVRVSLRQLWEPGQAYVALSRVRDSEDLFIDSWDPRSIIAAPEVKAFHQTIREASLL